MPKIIINEVDLTSAGEAAASTDVVFVPGFSATNFNYLIYSNSGEQPKVTTQGTKATELPNSANIHTIPDADKYPQYACNTADGITWACVSDSSSGQYVWSTQMQLSENSDILTDVPYIEPAPENTPVLCNSVSEFKAYFGAKPFAYQSDEDGNADNLFSDDALPAGDKYLYTKGSYDKSYIYAKELIDAGLPVVYYNVSNRPKNDTIQSSYATVKKTGEDTQKTNVSDVEKFLQNTAEFKTGSIVSCLMYKRTVGALPTSESEDTKNSSVETYIDVAKTFTQGTTVKSTTFKVASWSETNSKIVLSVDGTGELVLKSNNMTAEGIKALSSTATAALVKPENLYIGDKITVTVTQIAPTGTETSYTYKTKIEFQGGTAHPTDPVFVYSNSVYSKSESSDLASLCQSATFTSNNGPTIAQLGLSTLDTDYVMAYVYADIVTPYQKYLPTVKYMYEALPSVFYGDEDEEFLLLDKSEFSIKYITSGGYPTFEYKGSSDISSNMIKLASKRGDAVAIIDHANNPGRGLGTASTTNSVYAKLASYNLSEDEASYATMFTPYAAYSCATAPKDAQIQIMPASFGYLTALAKSIVTNPNFLAIAGVNRGLPPTIRELDTIPKLTNTIADAYQPRDKRALNAITNIKPYGLTIWGNRTLVNNSDGNLVATSFLNVRNLVSDIKKIAYSTARSLIYEQDSEILWNQFKLGITGTLDKMVTGYGISGYQIIRNSTYYNGDALGKGEIAATIKIVPLYAVETFEITVVMADEIVVE